MLKAELYQAWFTSLYLSSFSPAPSNESLLSYFYGLYISHSQGTDNGFKE